MYYKGEEIDIKNSGPGIIKILKEGNSPLKFKYEAVVLKTQEYVYLTLNDIILKEDE